MQQLVEIKCPVGEAHCDIINECLTLRRRVEQLELDARSDALTGLYNYRHFETTLITEMDRAVRSQLPLALMIIDIDHFKAVNDDYGHEAGNQALQQVAHIISAQVRKMDTPCRFGGEEFAVILPSAQRAQAVMVAERIRQTIAEQVQVHNKAQAPRAITASFGVACYELSQPLTLTQFVEAADEQLYNAKDGGRNCVCAKAPEQTSSPLVTSEEKSALFGVFSSDD